ncbi:Do family serine endopeptidase [Sphingomonas sp. CROZ-RG-20F-R02-07]|uniref:Do family serine endopeptidase n=1 Tax=Sphingomonas sp. CROZ-RG-20F-R02-07 TaxID=2914832 RepID=UPI001F599DC0
MRYAYALTTALLLGGATASLALQPGQTAQNDPALIAQAAPRPGAPMSFADLVAKLQPAVVNISTKQSIVQQQQANPFAGTPFGELFGGGGAQSGPPVKREGASLGSGFLISADGYVVTNNHVIEGAKGATVESISVTLVDGKEYTAKVVGKDPTSDLALLKVNATGLPFVRFGDSTRSRVGDWVLAIGNPFGLGSTVTAGIVSALHRVGLGAYDRFIQTDAAINQGNSGGPMFNLNGEVIGINSQIISQSGGNVGIGFAIPAEDAAPIIETLRRGNSVKRGYLGIGIQPVTDDIAAALGLPKDRGELISRIEPNQAAQRAGLKAGDVVVRVNGKEVTPQNSLSRLVADVPPGGTARLDVIRDNKPLTLTATAGTRPSEEVLQKTLGGEDDDGLPDDDSGSTQAAPATGTLGLNVVPLTPGIARSIGVDAGVTGIVIASVDPSSDAAQKQLKRGDVIVSINGTPTRTVAALTAGVAAARAAGRDQVLLFVQRGKIGQFIPVKIKK